MDQDQITRTLCPALDLPRRGADCDPFRRGFGAAECFRWRGQQHLHLLFFFRAAATGASVGDGRLFTALACSLAAEPDLWRHGIGADRSSPMSRFRLPSSNEE